MYRIYFKQAFAILKQNKFITIITITGTALAIMMIMSLIVSDSIKNTNIVPEVHRDRMLYIKYQGRRNEKQNSNSYEYVQYNIYKTYLSNLKNPELVCFFGSANDEYIVSGEDRMSRQPMKSLSIDDNYWKLFSFSFIEGSPFTKEDFDSGLKKAVITKSAAEKLYGKQSALGKEIEIDFQPYTVVGIVKDVSPVFKYSSSDVYMPYTSSGDYKDSYGHVLMLAKTMEDFALIEEEVREAERKYSLVEPDWELTLSGPYNHRIVQLNNSSNLPPDAKKEYRKTIFILLLFLIVPALNLSSFSMSQIKKRTEEIGIRKAFGARKSTILLQVLQDNFLTSLIGGVIGLMLSYIVVVQLKDWLLDVDTNSSIPIEGFVSIPIFIGVFIACIILNLLSASIPAFRASRMNIIDSLNKNNQKAS